MPIQVQLDKLEYDGLITTNKHMNNNFIAEQGIT